MAMPLPSHRARVFRGDEPATSRPGKFLQKAVLAVIARHGTGRGVILAIAVLQLVVAVLFMSAGMDYLLEGAAWMQQRALLILFLALVFGLLWVWAGVHPLPAAITALVLYSTLFVADFVVLLKSDLNPGISICFSILLKSIFLGFLGRNVFLSRGVKGSSSLARRLRAQPLQLPIPASTSATGTQDGGAAASARTGPVRTTAQVISLLAVLAVLVVIDAYCIRNLFVALVTVGWLGGAERLFSSLQFATPVVILVWATVAGLGFLGDNARGRRSILDVSVAASLFVVAALIVDFAVCFKVFSEYGLGQLFHQSGSNPAYHAGIALLLDVGFLVVLGLLARRLVMPAAEPGSGKRFALFERVAASALARSDRDGTVPWNSGPMAAFHLSVIGIAAFQLMRFLLMIDEVLLERRFGFGPIVRSVPWIELTAGLVMIVGIALGLRRSLSGAADAADTWGHCCRMGAFVYAGLSIVLFLRLPVLLVFGSHRSMMPSALLAVTYVVLAAYFMFWRQVWRQCAALGLVLRPLLARRGRE